MMPIMKSRFPVFLLFAFASLLVGNLFSGELRAQANKRVQINTKLIPAQAAPGQKVTLILEAKVKEGYHIYSTGPEEATPTKLEILDSGGLKPLGKPVDPEGTPHQDELGNFATWLKGTLVFKRTFEIPEGKALGTLKGRFSYLPCTEDFCEQKTEEKFQIPLGNLTSGKTLSKTLRKIQEKPKAPKGEIEILSIRTEPSQPAPGQKVRLVLKAQVKDTWHVYGPLDEFGAAPEIQMEKSEAYKILGKTALPSGTEHKVMGVTSWWIQGIFEAAIELRLAKDLKKGDLLKLAGKLAYTPCTKDYCLPAKDLGFKTEVKIGTANILSKGETKSGAIEGNPPSKTTNKTRSATLKASPKTPLSKSKTGVSSGLWKIILGGILAGLLALLMPCTYPMIPITFSFFTKQAHDRHGSIVPLTLVYGAGIVGVFILIGLIVGQPIIIFATHWITNLVIGTVFVIFALSLFGVLTLNPPRFLMDAAGKASMKGGYLGVFLMGTTLVITSFTCTVPFISTLLAAAATKGSMHVIAGMGAFGLTMALPFMALSLIPGKMQALPRAGEWMNTLKVFLGFVEIAAALKFFSNVDLVLGLQQLPNELFLALWTGLFMVAGFYLLGMIPYKTDSSAGIGSGRLLGGIASVLFAFYFLFGALGFPYNNIVMNGLIPGYSVRPQGATVSKEHSIVIDDFDKARSLAKNSQKRVLINFTGFM
jgi:thiol:disulfide interchange protein DsbD